MQRLLSLDKYNELPMVRNIYIYICVLLERRKVEVIGLTGMNERRNVLQAEA